MNAPLVARPVAFALAAVRRVVRHLRGALQRSELSFEERYLSQSVDAADLERRLRHLDAESTAEGTLRLSFARHARP